MPDAVAEQGRVSVTVISAQAVAKAVRLPGFRRTRYLTSKSRGETWIPAGRNHTLNFAAEAVLRRIM